MSPDGRPRWRKRPGPEPESPATESDGTLDQGVLFLEFARGSSDAIAEATRLVGAVVRTRGYYVPPDERPDVIQEAIVDVLNAAKKTKFASDKDFYGFIRMVTHRRCIDWVRQARKRARVAPDLKRLIGPDDRLMAKERRTLATDVFQKLKKPCQDLIALRIGRGMSYGQMSELLGKSEGALRTQSYYCLKQARTILDRMRRRQKLVRLDDWRRS